MPGRSSHRLTIALAVVCALALLAGGCGGGGKSTKEELAAAAKQYQRDFKKAFTKLTSARTQGQYEAAVGAAKGSIVTFKKKIRSVDAPKDAKPARARLIRALDALASDMSDTQAALRNADIERVQTLLGRVGADQTTGNSAYRDFLGKVD